MKGRLQHSWPADQVIFLAYRWASWGLAVVFVLWANRWEQYAWLFVASGVVNLLALGVSPAYVRAARRNPAVLILDMLFMTWILLPQSGAWAGPFAVHAASSLVLPALLFGWRGGVMAGLAFVPLNLGANWAMNNPPALLIEQERWLELLTTMLVPPVFGYVFAWTIELPRRWIDYRRQTRQHQRPSGSAAPLKRSAGSDIISRFSAIQRGPDQRPDSGGKFQLASPATAVRTTEQGPDELRRMLFAPLPGDDVDLPTSVDVLAMRFGKYTGTATRVTVLGRTRALRRAQRLVLVRLTQEALLNVQQHAHAATTTFTIRYDAGSVALLVQDDGVGLLDGTYERPGLHALRAMHYRVSELGGRMDVFETEGGGVTVRATMPLE